MIKNRVRETLSQGKVSLGGWLNLGSPLAAEMMASAGFEWLTIDAEHAPFDLSLIAETFRAIDARGVVPFVRAWDHDPVALARLLDAGAFGVIVPHVSTPQQARALAGATRYAPRGTRSVGTGRIAVYGPAYRKTINDELLVIPQIEDLEGIQNAEAIMSVEGVDVGFLGPADLALSMGVEPGHPDHEAAIQKFLAACKKVGKPCGLPIRVAPAIKKRIAEGFRLIDIASDLRLVEAGAQGILRAVRTEA
jgi:4-hydroxy-2-oxoheptanedioate aldolase